MGQTSAVGRPDTYSTVSTVEQNKNGKTGSAISPPASFVQRSGASRRETETLERRQQARDIVGQSGGWHPAAQADCTANPAYAVYQLGGADRFLY
ncbi:hypothetical protein PCURB6_36340 [Paenibacillus curdlanolyticus]|nr:hypothetical protein PCURB6_36340 [Paenibacillus curdlanolyticus]